MRQSDRRAFLRALTLLPFSGRKVHSSARRQSADRFQGGWNHPWIGYGHDFGRAWGHDGLSTNGWTCETYPDTQGFTDSEVTLDSVTGRGALRIRVELQAGHPNRSRGAVSLSLADHWPFGCPPREGSGTANLDRVLARYRIRLPKGSAGPPDAPNRLQLVLKTRLTDERWPSLYTRAVDIRPAWEDRYVEIPVTFDPRSAAYRDPDFDIRKVSLIGLTIGTSAGASSSTVEGNIWLDDFVLYTDPPLAFRFDRPEIDAQFAEVRRRTGGALSLVRFFIFCDGRAAPTFAADGSVSGIDPVFYRDFDVLLDSAARHRVFLMPVLLDFGWCARARMVSGVQLGGHTDVIRDPAKRRTFISQALEPVLERYGRHPAIFAWDVCNEPEWVVDEIPGAFRQGHDTVSLAEMRAFVQNCVASVHRLTQTQLATVGSVRATWLRLWRDLDLDLYQFHWYDNLLDEERFPWGSVDELGLDRPCLIGEVPTAGTRFTPRQFLAAAQAGGYSGLLFWSFGARDQSSNFCSPAP